MWHKNRLDKKTEIKKKLLSKLTMNKQLLDISKEELFFKRKLVEQLEKSKTQFNLGTN